MNELNSTDSLIEVWQIDAGGEIYEAEFDDLKQWIADRVLLPQDKVRRGNLRWIEAQKVPALRSFFNDKEFIAETISSSVATNQNVSQESTINTSKQSFDIAQTASNFPNIEQSQIFIEAAQRPSCLVHLETKPTYICMACANVFCSECPQSFGNTVKVCPMCGGMCNFIKDVFKKEQRKITFHHAVKEGFGFVDLKRAFEYPFKFRTSLLWGTLIYSFAYIGQNAYMLGGRWLISASMFCWLLTNMLTFGILAQTVENMLQGKINQDFLPKFEDFTLWDDAIHPLILVLSSYIVSFGAFILVCIIMVFMIADSIKSDKNNLEILNSRIQSIKLQAKERENYIKQQTESADKQAQDANFGNNLAENDSQELEKLIDHSKQKQVIQTQKPSFLDGNLTIYKLITSWGIPFALLIVITFLWGVFYFPMALIVASYTRKVSMTLNPLVGLDTIKRLGFDYIKILFFSFLLYFIGAVVSLILNFLFAPFSMSNYGNIPVLVIGGILAFYLSVVFSTLIGFALYKNLNSLPLYQATPRY